MQQFHFDSDIIEEQDEFLTEQGIIKITNEINIFNCVFTTVIKKPLTTLTDH